MDITINKRYETNDGFKVRIFAIFPQNKGIRETIFGAVEMGNGTWEPFEWFDNGCFYEDNEPSGYDLKEVENGPESWRRNKPIMVKDGENDEWVKRHFYKYEDGRLFVYLHGKTSFTTEKRKDGTPDRCIYRKWREPTQEELG